MDNYEYDYLAHHGIKGQKWGIRRFQNPDGTRTFLGKKREREQVDHDKLIKSTDAKELYKHRDQLSDRELQDRLNRLRNEKALKDMTKNPDGGRAFVKKIMTKMGEKSAEVIAATVVSATVAAVMTKGKDTITNTIKDIGSMPLSFIYGPERWVI